MQEYVIVFDDSLRGITCAQGVAVRDGSAARAAAQQTRQSAPHAVDSSAAHGAAAPDTAALLQQLHQDLTEQLAELEHRRRNTLSEMQQLGVEIATAAAERFLHREIKAGNHDIEKLVSAAITRFDADSALTIQLHPQDLQLLQSAGSKKLELLNHGRNVRFRSNAVLTRGNCRVDADHYGVLFDWETQLAEIRATLLRTLDDAEIERRQTRPDGRQLGRFPDRRETA